MTQSESSTPGTLEALARVARAPFLLLSVVLVAAGAAAAYREGDFSWLRTGVALIGLIGLHVAVNAFNEVSDFKSGIDLETRRTPFSGGSGVLPAGGLSPRAGLCLGVLGVLVGLSAGIWFLTVVGWKLLPILVIGGLATLAYTDLLARCHVGEFFAGFGLGALPIVGTAMVQAGRVGQSAAIVAVPAFLMTFNLLLLNEFPDEEADRKGGRRNLVHLLGREGAARLYVVAAMMVPLWVAGSVILEALPSIALVALVPSLLLVAPLQWALTDPAEDVPVSALGANVGWNLATNAVMAAALLAAGRLGF